MKPRRFQFRSEFQPTAEEPTRDEVEGEGICPADWLQPTILCCSIVILSLQPLLGATLPIDIRSPGRTNEIHFRSEILPLLQANCLPCHNQTRAKANLNLETPESMVKGGDTGTALIPGKPSESLMLRTAAHQVEDLVMPPAENKANARNLTPEELGLLSLWIGQGARAEVANVDVPTWKPIATNWLSSFAVAVNPNGRWVAVARANQIHVHDVQTGRLVGRLSDAALHGAAQRDWVGALAFSPDDSMIAAAGFREVRLWQLQPPLVNIHKWPGTNGAAVSAAFSADGTRLARITVNGHLEILAIPDGNLISDSTVGMDFEGSKTRLAWSQSGHWLAMASGAGLLQIVSTDSPASSSIITNAIAITGMAWWDGDRQLAVTLSGTNTVHRFRRADGDKPILEDCGEFSGPADDYTTLTAAGDGKGSVIAGTQRGTLRRWNSDPAAAPQEVALESPILKLESASGGKITAASLQSGGAILVTWGEKPVVSQHLPVDTGPSNLLTHVQFKLDLAKLELVRATSEKTEAESAKKTADEAAVKAREKKAAHARTLADQEKELAHQREVEAAAIRDRDDLAAQLERAAKAFQSADIARQEGLNAGRTAAEQNAAARGEAASANRLRGELERLAASLPPSDNSDSAQRLRESARAIVAQAEELERRSSESRARLAKAMEELAERAFNAGQRKAETDRAQSEFPPRKKQAEERLAAAQKAATDLDKPIAKSRIALDGSTQDLDLAEKAISRAVDSLSSATRAETTARGRITAAEAQMAAALGEIQRVAKEVPESVALSTNGSALLLISNLGRATRWSLASLQADLPLDLSQPHPLDSVGRGDHDFGVAYSDHWIQINTQPAWALVRTLGGEESANSPRSFVDRVNAVCFSPDGRTLATGGGEPSRSGELKLWNIADGNLVRDFGAIHSDCITSVAFSPRGEWLATGGADRFARVTPVLGEGPRLALEGHTHHVLGVAWLADGSLLASAGAEGSVKFWNPLTGERKGNVDGLGKEVTGIQAMGLNPEFVIMNANGRGRILRANGEKVRDLHSAPEYVQTLSVNQDGTLAVGTDDQGVLSVWNLNTGEIRRDAAASGGPSGL